MAARTKMAGRFTIGGDKESSWPSLGAAIAVAQTRALRKVEPVRIGVFEHEDKVARVERLENGVVITVTA